MTRFAGVKVWEGQGSKVDIRRVAAAAVTAELFSRGMERKRPPLILSVKARRSFANRHISSFTIAPSHAFPERERGRVGERGAKGNARRTLGMVAAAPFGALPSYYYDS